MKIHCILLAALAPMAFAGILPVRHYWENLHPNHMTVNPIDVSSLPKEVILEKAFGLEQPRTERYPGYKKGTKSFSAECGVHGPDGLKITGGEEATPHEYPWMAAIFMTRGESQYFCGGTLISDEWVMTAAHCVDGFDKLDVMLGAHNVRDPNAPTEEFTRSYEVLPPNFFTHESWSSFFIRNDIGLVKLPEKVEFNDAIKPVCLPAYSEMNQDFANMDAPISGWGKPTDSSNGISEVLREAVARTISNFACFFELFQITNNNICISGAHGISTCNGDSGGPLHIVTDDGRYKEVGITSFGLVFGCELGLHAAFTRVTSYLEWIETHTGIAIDP